MSTLVKTKAYPAPDSWFTSLAYYKNPTRSMMESVLVSIKKFAFSLHIIEASRIKFSNEIISIEFRERRSTEKIRPFGRVFDGSNFLSSQPRLLPDGRDSVHYHTVWKAVKWQLLCSWTRGRGNIPRVQDLWSLIHYNMYLIWDSIFFLIDLILLISQGYLKSIALFFRKNIFSKRKKHFYQGRGLLILFNFWWSLVGRKK